MVKILFLLSSFFIFTSEKALSSELGKRVYVRCIACHGLNGEGKELQNAPKLAGQYSWYLERQILAFKNKERTGEYAEQMYPFVGKLSPEEVKAVSLYISSMEPKK